MPIISPSTFIDGPPELPGLMLASVWIRSTYFWASLTCTLRFRALMKPHVTVCGYPNALPMATTRSPSIRSPDVPILISGRLSLTGT